MEKTVTKQLMNIRQCVTRIVLNLHGATVGSKKVASISPPWTYVGVKLLLNFAHANETKGTNQH